MSGMSEIDRIADQLDRAFAGDAWHGDPVTKILSGINSKEANLHAIRGAHSIWEIVNHLRAWKTAIPIRLTGEVKELSPQEDWPMVTDNSEASWQNSVNDLRQLHGQLVKAVRAFPESKLTDKAPNRDHSYYVLLHGMVQHDLYHAGQIALLKKAVR